MHNYGYQPMMGYWSLGSVIGHIILFVVVVALIMWALRLIFWGGRRGRWSGMGMMGGPGHMGHHGAISILRERYAKGEITQEEFEERKKVLMQ